MKELKQEDISKSLLDFLKAYTQFATNKNVSIESCFKNKEKFLISLQIFTFYLVSRYFDCKVSDFTDNIKLSIIADDINNNNYKLYIENDNLIIKTNRYTIDIKDYVNLAIEFYKLKNISIFSKIDLSSTNIDFTTNNIRNILLSTKYKRLVSKKDLSSSLKEAISSIKNLNDACKMFPDVLAIEEDSFDIGQAIKIENDITKNGVKSAFCFESIASTSIPLNIAKEHLILYILNILRIQDITKEEIDRIIGSILKQNKSDYFKEFQNNSKDIETLNYYNNNIDNILSYIGTIAFIPFLNNKIIIKNKEYDGNYIKDAFIHGNWYFTVDNYYKFMDKSKIKYEDLLEYAIESSDNSSISSMEIEYDNGFPIAISFMKNKELYKFVLFSKTVVPYGFYKVEGNNLVNYDDPKLLDFIENVDLIPEIDRRKCFSILDDYYLKSAILSNCYYRTGKASESIFNGLNEKLFEIWGKNNGNN